jgi:predicted transcriptional regulator of viral defense system
MNTLLKPLQVRETLLKKGIRIFTPQDFERIFHTPSYTTKYFLETQTNAGLFVRLKQGIYTLKTDLPSEEEIANALYKPSYISFEYALAYYNMIPEMLYKITSATTKPTRLFTTNNISYAYYTIKEEAYTGYTLIKTNKSISIKSKDIYFNEIAIKDTDIKSFYIAEPEKALVDYLYFVSLGKRMGNDRLYYKDNFLNKKKLVEYAKLYNRKKLIELIQKYL